MRNVIIEVENISKLYRLGQIGTGTLSHDLNRWFAKVRGKEDPFLKVDEVNDRTTKTDKAFAWALQDINFDVAQGEVLGIVGSNGAGKSTLLKILSEITAPTTGAIRINGNVASLLEVGTGFHPELTGRENIFLNGAILGMTKREIRDKLDEIIDFAGVERYIDTPVKRYSSGMYVRLAFAVAAHLEPEILIIDEVLAVGDADFQRKCMGKMKDVSQKEGRTILFVSHNMQAVRNLCDRAIWLQHGRVKQIGNVVSTVNAYLSGLQHDQKFELEWQSPDTAPGNEKVRLKHFEVIPHFVDEAGILDVRTPIDLKIAFWNYLDDAELSIDISLMTYSGECIFAVSSPVLRCQKGVVQGLCRIPGNLLNNGSYNLGICITKDTTTALFEDYELLPFDIEDYRGGTQYFGKWYGAIRPHFPFSIDQDLCLAE